MRIPRFFIRYIRRELRRRARQALLVGCGLGLGTGLVMTVSAASAGVADAQAAVLRSLFGLGTGLTVTAPASHAGGIAGGIQDPTALLPGDLGPMPASVVAAVSRLPHVASAAGGLRLSEIKRVPAALPVSVTVDGVDLARPGLGPLAGDTTVSGRGLGHGDSGLDVAVLDAGYAAANKLSVGSAITLGGAHFRVVGIVSHGSADVYIPLGRAAALARSPDGKPLTGQVNVIYAAADSAPDVAAVQGEVSRLLPSATVTSASGLARAVTGSLRSTASLADDLGTWVASAALIAAVAVASLLTIAAVTRRIRELGTLKALGWCSGRIIGQIMGESLVIGTFGAALGMAAGFAGAALVNGFAPALTAIIPQDNGPEAPAIIDVRLAAHVSPLTAAAAALLAIGGALLAGALGAWRAARLQPADAFARIT